MLEPSFQSVVDIWTIGAAISPETVLLCFLFAFIMGQAIAWIYSFSHTGLSYSRTFTQSLILLPLVSAMVMLLIGNNVVAAFGLLGALAVIRFRNIVKDTRDMAFIFGSIVAGMGIGREQFATVFLGVIALGLISLYMRVTAFGTRGFHDGLLRFRLDFREGQEEEIARLLWRHCQSKTLVTVRRMGGDALAEYSYRVSLRDRRRNDDLLAELQEVEGVRDASLAMQEELQEI